MSAYDVVELGGLDTWTAAVGVAPGKRFVDKQIPMQYIGMSANGAEPGASASYAHSHSSLEELYVFLAGTGQMSLDGELVDVRPGTTVRVGQGVMRAWHANADSTEPLRWLCIRAAGAPLAEVGHDGARGEDPLPWA